MADLIAWMRHYNESAEPGEDLRFYGFDMQRNEYNFQYLLEGAKEFEVDTTELEKLWDSEKNGYSEDYNEDQIEKVLEAVKQKLLQKDEHLTGQTIHFVDILLQNIELGKVVDSAAEGNALRDRLMAENALWILEQEKERGNSCIFLTGHNGHLEQSGAYGSDDKVMGNLLADEFGDDYFVIGTDFYKTSCSLPKGNDGKRRNHTFYSHDPLAKASQKCGYEMSWLDFSGIPEESELKKTVTDYLWMGSLGEFYNPLYMNLLPMSYRVWRSPTEMYNGMIFVTSAHPTEIRSYAGREIM